MAGLPPVEVPAWSGCLGLEPDPAMFVGHIVLIWRELWRVMRDDATCWLNFGDSYSRTTLNHGKGGNLENKALAPKDGYAKTTKVPIALKPKDLIGIPWRVAFALQADGWYLRSDIIWAKGVSFCPTYSGSCMPESVRDRPTKGHEYVFLLSKNKRYFYDGDAVRESNVSQPHNRGTGACAISANAAQQHAGADAANREPDRVWADSGGRNLRTVWTINPGSYAGAHFATFSPKLVEPMIKAGTSAKGCCPECGDPWVRVTETTGYRCDKTPAGEKQGSIKIHPGNAGRNDNIEARNESEPFSGRRWREDAGLVHGWTKIKSTTGWAPTCSHYDALYYSDFAKPKDPRKWAQRAMSGNWFKRARKRPGLPGWPIEPCTVLDPFAGTFTTGQEAIKLGRRAVGIELSKSYCDDHIIPRLSKGIQMEMGL